MKEERSPCYDCEHLDEDKNIERCANCEARISYARRELMISEEEKIMSKEKHIVCVECGEEKPNRGRGMCHDCYNRWYYNEKRENGGKNLTERCMAIIPHNRKNDKEMVEEKKANKQNFPIVMEAVNVGKLAIDFSEYSDLYQQLQKRALDEFRSIEMQALFLIKQGLENGKKGA